MSEELIEVRPEIMSGQRTGYPGAFPPNVESRIKRIAGTPCLHLFSGRSSFGDERVDFSRPEATLNMDVFDFIKTDPRVWEWVVADPPYDISHANDVLRKYAKRESVTGQALYQKAIDSFLQGHANNVLWFDQWTPRPRGFIRERVWVYVGAYSWVKPRFLTWLKREGERLA